MSAIHCSVCSGSNPPGSKFCNHCGSPLPPETHIVCPNCQHYNSLHLLYCDYCGTRLVNEDSAAEPSPSERELPAAPKVFNLPTRATDDTGELKLPQLHQSAIPDWLKDTPQTDNPPSVPPPGTQPPQPIPAAPAPLEPDADPTDPQFADFARWLEDMSVEEAASQPNDVTPPPASTPETDNLADWLDANDEIVSPRDNLPDWLRAAAPRGTGILSTTPRDTFNSASPPPHLDPATDVPDWLAEIAPPGTGILTTKRSLDEEDIFDALATEFEVPDWLRHTDKPPQLVESKVEPLPEQTPPAPARKEDDQDTSAPPKPDDTPDWLAQLATEESGFTPPETNAADALPDWLAELKPDAQTLLPETELPDWLTAAQTARQEPEPDESALPELELLDWLTPFAADEAGKLSPEASPKIVDKQPTERDAALWPRETPTVGPSDGPAESNVEAGSGDAGSEDAGSEDAGSEDAASAKPQSWLSDRGEPAPDSAKADLLAAEMAVAGNFPDRLDEREDAAAEEEAQTERPDWLTAADAQERDGEEPAAGLTFTPETLAEDLPDWLDTLFHDDTLGEAETETTAKAEALPNWLTEFAADAVLVDDAALADAAALVDDAALADTAALAGAGNVFDLFDQGQPEQVEPTDLPEWLNQLPVSKTPAEFDADLDLVDLADDEWLEEAWKAAEGPTAAGFTDSAAPATDLLVNASDELASAELPDWLQDSLRQPPGGVGKSSLTDLFAGFETRQAPSDANAADLPDWLQPPDASGFDAALQAALLSRDEAAPSFGTGDEWSDVLGAMPTAVPGFELPSASEFAGIGTTASELVAADIPEWLQPFKPYELRGPGETYVPAEPIQETGPLAGMRGVIDIEPVIAQPRQAESELPQFTVTPAQRQQASLLRHLAQSTPAPVVAADVIQPSGMPVWLRLLLALLLLAAVTAGVLLPNLVSDLVGMTEAPLPASAVATYEMIQAAAGQPVLVAFDYTPAMSGELGPSARLLLTQLAANGSTVLTISQSAAGVTLAGQTMAQVADLNGTNLGYLPGEAVGLRLLGSCVAAPDSCQTIAGTPLPLSRPGRPISLIIVLTADQENLINWIEQVGVASQSPLLAVVTQSLSPAAGPYFASGQLAGLIEGLPAAASYERLVTGAAGPITALHNTQGLAYWLILLLLLGGNLFYLAVGFISRRRGK